MYPYPSTNVNGAAVEVCGDKTTNSVFHSSGFALYIYICVCVCVYVCHLSLTRSIIDGIIFIAKDRRSDIAVYVKLCPAYLQINFPYTGPEVIPKDTRVYS